jgi:uncharacterized damage-inducible protein DinB
MSQARPEVWMRGPVPGYEALLQPVVHAFLQVREELVALAAQVPPGQLFARPGGAASIAFHVRHIGGATDRLLTYARGEALTAEQFATLKAEGLENGESLDAMLAGTFAQIARALEQVQRTSLDDLLTERKVGRAGHPTTTMGLLFHAAEHATRHAGQALTTAKILAGDQALGARGSDVPT